jgi:hypothetical protein
MKAFKVIYQHGHFIDKESKERIIPVQGQEYIITANESAFTTEDSKLKMAKHRDASEKADWALGEFGKGNFRKILAAGDQLFFRIGNSNKVKGDESREYVFVCHLLEDLYLYLLKGKKGDKQEDWRLANCQCVLDECLLGGLALTEKIPAESLNKLFSQTVMFYFSMQRSGSCNAFHTFFKYTSKKKINFDAVTKKLYASIGDERKKIVEGKNGNLKVENKNLFP